MTLASSICPLSRTQLRKLTPETSLLAFINTILPCKVSTARPQAVLLHARASRTAWAVCTVRSDYEIPRHLPSSVHAHSSSLHTADPSAGHSEHHHLLDSFGGIACPTTGPSPPGRSRAVSEPCPSHLILPPTGLARVKVWTSQYGII